jgi:catechol 2,3-dioxygenase-like lactoylglutathione lyase family enzyme
LLFIVIPRNARDLHFAAVATIPRKPIASAIIPGHQFTEARKMLSASKIIGFVPTKDSAEARSFYEEKLGFKFVSDDPFALVMRAGETMIRIAKAKDFTPAPYTVMGWEVSNIEQEVAELNKRGVTFEKYPWVADKELGIWTAPGGDKVAWFKDPDGNVLSLSQHK